MVECVDKVDFHVSDYITTTSAFLKPLGALCWQCAFLNCIHQFGTSSERAVAWARHYLGICDLMHLAEGSGRTEPGPRRTERGPGHPEQGRGVSVVQRAQVTKAPAYPRTHPRALQVEQNLCVDIVYRHITTKGFPCASCNLIR